MRVLVLSQYFWPESFRITEVVESLRRVGCHVTVLTGQPNYPQGEVFEGYRAAGFGVQQHEAGYSIYRVPLVPRGRRGAAGLVANYFSFVLSATLLGPWLLRNQQFDVIFVYAPSPIIQAIPAVWLAFIKRAKLVTWVQPCLRRRIFYPVGLQSWLAHHPLNALNLLHIPIVLVQPNAPIIERDLHRPLF